MLSPMNFVVASVLALGLLCAGIFFVRNPDKVYRIFSFGQAENRFGSKLIRMIGWFYVAGGVLGLVMLGVAGFLTYFHSR